MLVFASYAERLGRSAFEVELPEGSTVATLLRSVAELPGGSSIPSAPLVAVNRTYAAPGTSLANGDEVALIPPVAGG